MLEHVAGGQTRFVVPGLSADARGVAMGRRLCVLLPSFDRVVGFFRALSAKVVIDELVSTMEILQVSTPLGSREFLISLPVTTSHGADGMASVSYLVGGLVFTGTAKHFIKYRDQRSPLGYDAAELQGGDGDFVLYAHDFVQVYQRQQRLQFSSIVLSLSLVRSQAGDCLSNGNSAGGGLVTASAGGNPIAGDEDSGGRVLLRLVKGLYAPVLGYLHRNGVRCSAAAVEVSGPAGGDPERFFLMCCEVLPLRMTALFLSTPGVEVFAWSSGPAAVQWGYEHPIDLGSCGSVLGADTLHLFSASRDRVDRISPPPTFVDARALVRFDLGAEIRTRHGVASASGAIGVPLRLVPVPGARPKAVGRRIPIRDIPRLRKLVYLLPQPVLAGNLVCFTEDHAYFFGEDGVDYLPIGDPYWETASGVLVPLGFSLLPAVAPDVLLAHLDSDGGDLFFFSSDDPAPQRFKRAEFRPLGRHSLAPGHFPFTHTIPGGTPPAEPDVHLANDDLGVFPLWGFDDPEGKSSS